MRRARPRGASEHVLPAECLRSYGMAEVNLPQIYGKLLRDQKLETIVSPAAGYQSTAAYAGLFGLGREQLAAYRQVDEVCIVGEFSRQPTLSVPVSFEKDTELPVGCNF